MSLTMLYDLMIATGETVYMVLVSTFFALLLGLPLGTLLFTSATIKPHLLVNRCIAGFINISRSIPFIILLVALIPLTRLLVGTSIGIHAAMVPLTLGAAPFFARLVSNAYQSLPTGLIEAGFSMGANTWQMVRHILLPEARPALIRYGYQRFNPTIMLATVAILVIIVQLLQTGGDRLSNRYSQGVS